ncbi:MAG: zinc ribbon domain-containing protein [Candidatus Zixiibacteriota bacterium]
MPAKRECPSCATEVPDHLNQCFVCGYEFAGKPAGRSWRTWVALILLLIFLIPLLQLLVRALR